MHTNTTSSETTTADRSPLTDLEIPADATDLEEHPAPVTARGAWLDAAINAPAPPSPDTNFISAAAITAEQPPPPSSSDVALEPATVAPPVVLAEGEVIKRDFALTTNNGPLGSMTSRVMVTDARVVYSAHASNVLGESKTTSEMLLADIAGIKRYTRRGVSEFAMSVAGACMAWAGFSALGGNSDNFVYCMLAAAAILIIGSRAKVVTFSIDSRAQSGSGISLEHETGGKVRRFIAAVILAPVRPLIRFLFPHLGLMDTAGALHATPTNEANAMFDELGAVVLDLQNRGVFGSQQ